MSTNEARVVGRAGGELFWLLGDQVHRAPVDQAIVNGRPTFARWECSAAAWERCRETVFAWVDHEPDARR